MTSSLATRSNPTSSTPDVPSGRCCFERRAETGRLSKRGSVFYFNGEARQSQDPFADLLAFLDGGAGGTARTHRRRFELRSASMGTFWTGVARRTGLDDGSLQLSDFVEESGRNFQL